MVVKDKEGILKDGITESRAKAFGEYVSGEIVTGSNMRAGAEYRKHLSEVFTRRCILKIGGGQE